MSDDIDAGKLTVVRLWIVDITLPFFEPEKSLNRLFAALASAALRESESRNHPDAAADRN